MRKIVILWCICLGCGPPMVIENPVPEQPASTAKPERELDYSGLGNPVNLDEMLDIQGVEPVWVRGTKFMLEVRTTKWDEFDGVREGRASLKIRKADETKVVTIEENREKVVFGFRISVAYAYEIYNDKDAKFVPHVKLKISR